MILTGPHAVFLDADLRGSSCLTSDPKASKQFLQTGLFFQTKESLKDKFPLQIEHVSAIVYTLHVSIYLLHVTTVEKTEPQTTLRRIYKMV